jgi:hypothetical protein
VTFQAYLDSIRAQTGKGPEEFAALAKKKGLAGRTEIVNWLKAEHGLGHGHANAMAHVLTSAGKPKVSHADKIAAHFAGKKAVWRKPYDDLMKKLGRFGGDVSVSATGSYLSLMRGKKKFGILAVTSDRMDLGIKLKGAPVGGRFEAAGNWNAMVTHRVRVETAKQIDAEVMRWLRQAYDAA